MQRYLKPLLCSLLLTLPNAVLAHDGEHKPMKKSMQSVDSIAKAVNNQHRPAKQSMRDSERRPLQTLKFFLLATICRSDYCSDGI